MPNTFPIDEARPAPEGMLDACRADVPEAVVQLWQEHGLSSFGEGRLQLVDPRAFRDTLARWVPIPATRPGRVYTPLLLTGFGELIYVRRLGSADRVPEENEPFDIQLLDPHYGRIGFMSWTLEDALAALDPAGEGRTDIFGMSPSFRPALFPQALKVHGKLAAGEAFHFAPALALGGAETIENVAKGDALVHLELLLSLRT
ncbi:MAG: DUF1851 domain-containing protein [Nannocystis sp.]|nr:DUF1851 domain-containing protein [Nannocystis sp.]